MKKVIAALVVFVTIVSGIATVTGFTLRDLIPLLSPCIGKFAHYLDWVLGHLNRTLSVPVWLVYLAAIIVVVTCERIAKMARKSEAQIFKDMLRKMDESKRKYAEYVVDVWAEAAIVSKNRDTPEHFVKVEDFAGTLAERFYCIERIGNDALDRAARNSKLLWSEGLQALRETKDIYLDKGKGTNKNFLAAYDAGYNCQWKKVNKTKGYVLEIIGQSARLLWWLGKAAVIIKMDAIFINYITNRLLTEPGISTKEILAQWDIYLRKNHDNIVSSVLEEARDPVKSPILYRSQISDLDIP